MPFLHTASKPILFVPIITIAFLVILSHGSVVEAKRRGEKLIIGVPGKASFPNFVRIYPSVNNPKEKNYTGFCIQLFEEVRKKLEFDMPYEFVEFDGEYDALVAKVANKDFSAAIGDITILAHRWKDVEFSEPFTESGLSMVVPLRPRPKAWIFLEPFTVGMWLATGLVLVYTMFIVWFFEHRSNPEFNGPWRDQLGNTLWFTFSSLFLAHRERIESNYARAVVLVWLFVALVLTQSYTASLTSMLTISRLLPTTEPPVKVGCDENTFMRKYVLDVLNFKSENVKLISTGDEYLRAFERGDISAAILEIPYAKVFVNKHCKKFTIIGSSYRFGGFGFVFQKGSPLTADVSKAILELSEDGTLKGLEEEWLTPHKECSESNSQATENVDSLSLQSFWGLFVFSASTSSLCFLLFIARLLRNYWQEPRIAADSDASNDSVSIRTVRIAHYLMNAEIGSTVRRAPTSSQVAPETHNEGHVYSIAVQQ